MRVCRDGLSLLVLCSLFTSDAGINAVQHVVLAINNYDSGRCPFVHVLFHCYEIERHKVIVKRLVTLNLVGLPDETKVVGIALVARLKKANKFFLAQIVVTQAHKCLFCAYRLLVRIEKWVDFLATYCNWLIPWLRRARDDKPNRGARYSIRRSRAGSTMSSNTLIFLMAPRTRGRWVRRPVPR